MIWSYLAIIHQEIVFFFIELPLEWPLRLTWSSNHWNNIINRFLDPKTLYNDVSLWFLPKLYNFSYLAAILAAILNFIKLTMGQKLFLAYLYSQLIVESIKAIKLPKTFTSNSTEPSSYNNTSDPHIYIPSLTLIFSRTPNHGIFIFWNFIA